MTQRVLMNPICERQQIFQGVHHVSDGAEDEQRVRASLRGGETAAYKFVGSSSTLINVCQLLQSWEFKK